MSFLEGVRFLSEGKIMIKKLLRKNIEKFKPYIAGKPLEKIKRELNLNTVYKLASNENPLPPSVKVRKTILKELVNLNRYPDSDGFYLKSALAEKFKLKTENVVLGNGTDELIEIIAKTFLNLQDEVIVSEHAFIRYRMAGEVLGCKVKTIPMINFTHNLKEMAKNVSKRTKLIYIANPNNPTGTYVNKDAVEDFFRKIPSTVIVVFDEAYYEYVDKNDYPQTVNYIKRNKNILVLRTFSKIYSLAGLRIGYGLGKKELISYLERTRPPFNTNRVAQVAAVVSLKDKSHIFSSKRLVIREKVWLETKLKQLNLKYIPTVTNFLLVNVGNGKEVFKRLLRKGVIVRSMDEYDLSQFIRVTVGLPKENRKFIRELRAILKK